MFDRILLFGLISVAMGACVAGASVVWVAARGTTRFWQAVRASRECTGCQRLGRRCPWCVEELWRGLITALGMVLPEVAWPLMVGGAIRFSSRAQLVMGAWAMLHLCLVLAAFLRL